MRWPLSCDGGSMMHEEDQLATECQAIQESLTELRGEVGALAPGARAHVDACPECREVAAAELALALVFRDAMPPAVGLWLSDPSSVLPGTAKRSRCTW